MAGKFSKILNAQEQQAEVDMTPMLDVVFIMLIFFIVSTSFVKETGVEVNQPAASTAQTQENKGILVAISQSGDVWLDQRNVGINQVRANIIRLKADNPAAGVLIQSDERADTGVLIKVMDQIRSAGITDIAIAAKAAN